MVGTAQSFSVRQLFSFRLPQRTDAPADLDEICERMTRKLARHALKGRLDLAVERGVLVARLFDEAFGSAAISDLAGALARELRGGSWSARVEVHLSLPENRTAQVCSERIAQVSGCLHDGAGIDRRRVRVAAVCTVLAS